MAQNLLRRGRYQRPLLLLLLLLLLTLISSQQAVFAANNSLNSHLSSAEKKYKQAKDYYYRLRRDKTIQDNRHNWTKGVRDFRQIYLDNPKNEVAPKCLFMLGTMHYRMFLQFQLQTDIDEALSYYKDVWLLFPDNSLADDAFYWSAEIHRKHRDNISTAAQLYTEQIKRYPQGDKYAVALNRLREIDETNKQGTRSSLVPESVKKELMKVLPVQYWSSDDYTRIVIRSSGPVTYTSKLLNNERQKPRKLLLDFPHSMIDKQYTAPVHIQEGLLQQIHSQQVSPTTVRITLNIETISNYKIFSLNDPFRVIVDVHGQQQVLRTSKPLPQLQQEHVKPKKKTSPPLVEKTVPQPDIPIVSEPPPPPPKLEEPFIVLKENNKRRPGTARAKKSEHEKPGLSLAQQLGLGVRRIVIDPGHGGKDPGAMGNGLKEKDITLEVARKTAHTLRTLYNYEVILTRDKDRTLPLEERTAIANTRKADLFISIHVNAHPNKSTRGVETFFLNLATNTEAMRVAALENATSTLNISDLEDILSDLMKNSKIQESSVLAKYVQNGMVTGLQKSEYPTVDLGVKQAPFYVLVGAKMPAILAEISFISNPKDARLLRKEQFLDEISRQIAAGISGYVDHQTTAALKL